MADSSSLDAESHTGPGGEPPPPAPRWVKVLAIIALVVVAMVAVMLLSGGNHGPGRHMGADGGASLRLDRATLGVAPGFRLAGGTA